MRTSLALTATLFLVLFSTVPPLVAATPSAWAPGVAYAVGSVAVDGDTIYRCLQAHTSQPGWQPHAQPALWSALAAAAAATAPADRATVAPAASAPPCAPAWDATTAYFAGASVSYDGQNYRNAWWTQGDVPPANTGVGLPWVIVGTCTPSASAAGPAAGSQSPTGTTVATTTTTSAPPRAAPNRPSNATACTPLNIAEGIDVCLPPVVCTAETCPPTLGTCAEGKCRFNEGYSGLNTFPEAWSTYYCTLSTGGCRGVTQVNYPEVTAEKIATSMSLPLCESVNDGSVVCVGIAASSPLIVGNSQEAIDPATGTFVAAWGMGMTEASGMCYLVTGPGGSAVVALTDRCGGYCRCGGSGFQECGPCVSAADMEPHCPCVGSLHGEGCCGMNCPTPTKQDCDWCASNNHPHFDFDTGTFAHVCGPTASLGSCRLTKVAPVACMAPDAAWPPGGGSSCGANQFVCNGVPPSTEQPVVPDTSCCCAWGMRPQPDGTCL